MTMAGGVFAWDAELMAMPDRTSRGGRAVWSRVGAVALALWWATGFFGVIDLLVGITPMEFPGFEPFVVVETSWGLLFTALVPMPLIAWAVRPVAWVGPQVLGVAAAVMVAGIAATAWGQVLVAVLVAACAGFPRMWRPRPDLSIRRVALSRMFWPVDALVAVGMAAAVVHAWDVLTTARTGVKDDDTWDLMHLPMQGRVRARCPGGGSCGRAGDGEWNDQLVVRDRAAGRLSSVVRHRLRDSSCIARQRRRSSGVVHHRVGNGDRRGGLGDRVCPRQSSRHPRDHGLTFLTPGGAETRAEHGGPDAHA
jgi:hypothetical protein